MGYGGGRVRIEIGWIYGDIDGWKEVSAEACVNKDENESSLLLDPLAS